MEFGSSSARLSADQDRIPNTVDKPVTKCVLIFSIDIFTFCFKI